MIPFLPNVLASKLGKTTQGNPVASPRPHCLLLPIIIAASAAMASCSPRDEETSPEQADIPPEHQPAKERDPASPETPRENPPLPTSIDEHTQQKRLQDTAELQAMVAATTEEHQQQEQQLDAAQTVLQSFLAAPSWEEKSAYVRDAPRVRPLMKEYHARPGTSPVAFQKLVARAMMSYQGKEMAGLTFLSGTDALRSVLLVKTDDGDFEVDWENFVAYSEWDWERILKERPTTPLLVRAYATPWDYHNYEFSDATKFASYRLDDRKKRHTIYAFAEKDSETGRAMQAAVGQNIMVPVILRISFNAGSKARDCVKIDEFVQSKWVRF